MIRAKSERAGAGDGGRCPGTASAATRNGRVDPGGETGQVTMEQILVVNISGIGDCVDSIPALQRLRQLRPTARIRLAVAEKSVELARCFPMVDDVIGLPTSPGRALPRLMDALRWGRAVAQLRGRYSMVINFYCTRSLAGRTWRGLLSVLAPADVRIDPLELTTDRNGSGNRVDDFLRTISGVDSGTRTSFTVPGAVPGGMAHDGLRIPASVTEEVRAWVKSLGDWKGLTGPLVVVALGGDRQTRHEAPKRAEQWLRLIQQRWTVRPIIIGLSKDPELPLGSSVVHVDGRGRWGLVQTVALIAMADVVISTHSAPQHVAGLWGVPTVSLVGPSDPVRYRPPLPDDKLRQLQCVVPCAPCYFTVCPLQGADHQRCMNGIPPEAVALAFGELVAGRPPSVDG
jgi:heptosyltransferase-1